MQIWTGRWRTGLSLCLLAFSLACDDDSSSDKDEEEGEESEEVKDHAEEGTVALAEGDLAGAAEAYEGYAEEEGDAGAAGNTGLAYLRLLEEDFDGALELLLEAREEASDDEIKQIDLRRAMVQLRAGRLPDYPDAQNPQGERLEGAVSLAKESDLPQGWLIVGEIALTEGERPEATEYFEKALDGEGQTAEVAEQYLALLGSEDESLRNLSEAVANWSVGMSSPPISILKRQAVEDFEKLGPSIEGTPYGSPEQMLVWAGRAASIREIKHAQTILGWAKGIEGEHAWRYTATEGIIYCADGDAWKCKGSFKRLKGMDPPPDGYRDAAATAAMLLGFQDTRTAEALVGDDGNSAVGARALVEANTCKSKETTEAEGMLGEYIQTSAQWEKKCSIE